MDVNTVNGNHNLGHTVAEDHPDDLLPCIYSEIQFSVITENAYTVYFVNAQ